MTIGDRVPEVLRRGLEAAGLRPEEHGVRIRLVRGVTQTAFAADPEPGDVTLDVEGIRLFLDPSLSGSGAVVIGVSSEHDQITVKLSR
ncbi:MAG: hypothetical protein ACRDJM_00500 [Actinomycetota bacterium]